jgi:hypothetical protein
MQRIAYSQTDRAKDGPKVGEAILHNSWLALFGGCFGICSVDLQKNNIQYSALEFKVISIIYITEFAHYESRRKRPDPGT